MRRAALLVLALLLTVGLAGCSSKKKDKPEEVIPEGIRREDLERAELLVSDFPLRYSFPGQAAIEARRIYFNGTFAAGDGATGVEQPTDEGPLDYGAKVVTYDLAAEVPVGQPAEIRMEMKWVGDPGRAGDLDIYVNVPGTNDAYSPGRVDESWNFNIGTKVRVVDAVHVDGQPYEVGIQLNNGRIVHPDGMSYSLQVDLVYGKDVLAPGVPYAITVPENATQLIFESEPLAGDEHLQSEFIVIGPNDQLIRHVVHNDIATETYGIVVPGPGEYVVYAHNMHGGFLRLESDVPNPTSMARPLATTTTAIPIHSGAPKPGTFAEMGNGAGNTWGGQGTFDVAGTFPLDLALSITGTASSSGALNVTSPTGWFGTAYTTATYTSGSDRVGPQGAANYDRGSLALGTYTYGVVANAPEMTMAVNVLSYVR